MSKIPKKKGKPPEGPALTPALLADFDKVVRMIEAARGRARAILEEDPSLLDFLTSEDADPEAALRRVIVKSLKGYLMGSSRDWILVRSPYLLQLALEDVELDLLFLNRELGCLVGIELRIEEFQPAYLGSFHSWVEALDQDVRTPSEGPSVGVLLCATKDHAVVEYALSRVLSPALVAEYQTRLPDKKLLQAKLHEFYELAQAERPALDGPNPASAKPPTSRKGKKP
jgi:hypothetical protein